VTGCLVTERMLLRRFTDADLDWLAALHGDPAVMRYIDDGRPAAPTVVAAETLPAILRDYAELPERTELGLERVVATTMTVNVASRRVLEKAGLSLVRTFYMRWPT
jgi:RimJ/RimL family protein N-acetyltransferase